MNSLFGQVDQNKNGKHNWDEDYKCVESDNIGFNDSKCAVIILGKTGCGKSSLIKALTGNNNIQIGMSNESCTTQCGFYEKDGILYIDTKGGLDINEESENTLKNIQKQCYDHKINTIKFIWCVDGSIRTDAEFETEAQSIESYDNKKLVDVGNIGVWDCCLIVEKEGRPDDSCHAALGAWRSVAKNTNNENNIKNNCIGFTCVDWIKSTIENGKNIAKRQLQDKIDDYNGWNQTKREQRGYFTEKKVISLMQNKLSNIPSLSIKFNIQKCDDCGIIGDPSFVTEKCHWRFKKVHCGRKIKFHNGYKSSRYHSGFYEQVKVNNETIYGDLARAAGDGVSGAVSQVFWAHPGVHVIRLFQSNTKTISRWSCCHSQNRNAIGCQDGKYSCCQRTSDANGCKDKCSQCNRVWTEANGCAHQCIDCGKRKGRLCANRR